MQEYMCKNLRIGKYGGIDVVGLFEQKTGVLEGQTLTQFLGNYKTEEEAKAAHPEAEMYTNAWMQPQVSLSHLSDEGDY
jgi:hypothetical protein